MVGVKGGIIRSRQRKWLCPIMRKDSLLRSIIEGRMEKKKTSESPRIIMLLDCMMKEDQSMVMERAEQCGEWPRKTDS